MKSEENILLDNELLETEYLRLLKIAYDKTRNTVFFNHYRNYEVLLCSLGLICSFSKQHAKSFVNRIKQQQKNLRQCEATFTEIIVYAYYLKLLPEGILKSLQLQKNDYDLKLELVDGSISYYEIFSIMPNLKISSVCKMMINDIKTHLHDEYSSIRQKLRRKILEQKQLRQARNNFAVIELNDPVIAGDFSVLSSLSDGYKINIDAGINKNIDEGYDWNKSIFDDEITKYIKGIIYFSLGDYSRRRCILNPNFNLT